VPRESAESPLHESSQIRLRGFVWFLVCFITAAVVIHAVVWGTFAGLRAVEQHRDAPVSAAGPVHVAPPAPQIQPSVGHDAVPVLDVAEMREKELAEYRRRGWIDEATGRVRIKPEVADEVIRMSGGTPGQAATGRPVPHMAEAMGSAAVTQPGAVAAFPNRGGGTTKPTTQP